MSVDAFLNNFAVRSFRDTADYDYIAARTASRARLIPNFHWSGLQAIEKYLKCILLLNRVPKEDLRHNLGKALALVESKVPFPLRLSQSSRDLLQHLDKFGRFRYLEVSYYVLGLELWQFDRTVGELRRYCQLLNYSATWSDGSERAMLPLLLKGIEQAEAAPHRFSIMGGMLERILDDPKHPARHALVWKNMCFGKLSRKQVRVWRYSQSTNSPLTMNPQMLDEVLKYVYVPKDVADAFRAATAQQASGISP